MTILLLRIRGSLLLRIVLLTLKYICSKELVTKNRYDNRIIKELKNDPNAKPQTWINRLKLFLNIRAVRIEKERTVLEKQKIIIEQKDNELEKKEKQIVKRMLGKGLVFQFISEITGLSIEEIEQIKKSDEC